MKRGRTASQWGIADSERTSTAVMATSETESGAAETGAPEWADTHARQVPPEASALACTCTACAHTANRTMATQTDETHHFQRNSNIGEVFIMGATTCTLNCITSCEICGVGVKSSPAQGKSGVNLRHTAQVARFRQPLRGRFRATSLAQARAE
jgi:hypothetical protein